MPRARATYRRSSSLVFFWEGERLIVHNYVTGSRIAAAPTIVALLAAFDRWRSVESLTGFGNATRLSRIVARLHHSSFLYRSDEGLPSHEGALAAWSAWSPEAPFFHLSTKNVPYVLPRHSEKRLRAKALLAPPPSPLKRITHVRRVPLPASERGGSLAETLLARRTWRRFGSKRINVTQLATLLQMTWGVQRWFVIPGQGKLALKTSPSGGARHNLEAYVLASDVNGLAPGLYHYNPDDHVLERLRCARLPRISTYVPHQTWYDQASMLVVMTAVFARAQWRYPYARAYRSILIESGHFGQTFCLLATSLGLAPFCTGALADSAIERDLGIDGVTESVVYACGVGTRPAGVTWAPWPRTNETPRLLAPASEKKRRSR